MVSAQVPETFDLLRPKALENTSISLNPKWAKSLTLSHPQPTGGRAAAVAKNVNVVLSIHVGARDHLFCLEETQASVTNYNLFRIKIKMFGECPFTSRLEPLIANSLRGKIREFLHNENMSCPKQCQGPDK